MSKETTNKTAVRWVPVEAPVRGESERFRAVVGDRAVIVGGEHARENGWFDMIFSGSEPMAVVSLDCGKQTVIEYENYRVEEELSP
jgi:hypothetical protein